MGEKTIPPAKGRDFSRGTTLNCPRVVGDHSRLLNGAARLALHGNPITDLLPLRSAAPGRVLEAPGADFPPSSALYWPVTSVLLPFDAFVSS